MNNTFLDTKNGSSLIYRVKHYTKPRLHRFWQEKKYTLHSAYTFAKKTIKRKQIKSDIAKTKNIPPVSYSPSIQPHSLSCPPHLIFRYTPQDSLLQLYWSPCCFSSRSGTSLLFALAASSIPASSPHR